ncbi:hypothetical protein L4D09_13535 [Photobacterium makurazakiensis]|uniref:hypothetical protein n=1 Tax=Photobacterium makurazakiensis TaxID=2910234 RepID=UPI003D0D0265
MSKSSTAIMFLICLGWVAFILFYFYGIFVFEDMPVELGLDIFHLDGVNEEQAEAL